MSSDQFTGSPWSFKIFGEMTYYPVILGITVYFISQINKDPLLTKQVYVTGWVLSTAHKCKLHQSPFFTENRISKLNL